MCVLDECLLLWFCVASARNRDNHEDESEWKAASGSARTRGKYMQYRSDVTPNVIHRNAQQKNLLD